MKKFISASLLLCCFGFIYTAFAGLVSTAEGAGRAAFSMDALHLDPEMTGAEYRALFDSLREQKLFTPKVLGGRGADALVDFLDVGKRNLDWIEAINSIRPDSQKLELVTAENQVAIPITNPRESNRQIIQASIDALIADLPQSMKDFLFTNAKLPQNPPIADDAFLELARRVDKVYQQASRWLLQEPALFQYATRKRMDVRGYTFLQQEADLQSKLAGWKNLDRPTQERLTPWLINLCENSGGLSTCASEFSTSVGRTGEASTYYSKYLGGARKMYASFWDLQFPRTDVVWSSKDPKVLMLPFIHPGSQAAIDFLSNIEDEWKWTNWNLKLDYRTGSSRNTAHVIFEPGATPHVNGLGGSEITMDANRSLTDFTARWTIRHEFGHVLGFPDCYVEFYDQAKGVMINYQIDTTDLMCSRRGHFNQRMFDGLKQNYFR